MLAPSMPDRAAGATNRRWDAQDKLGVKVALPGLEEPVLWLDTILPLVRIFLCAPTSDLGKLSRS